MSQATAAILYPSDPITAVIRTAEARHRAFRDWRWYQQRFPTQPCTRLAWERYELARRLADQAAEAFERGRESR